MLGSKKTWVKTCQNEECQHFSGSFKNQFLKFFKQLFVPWIFSSICVLCIRFCWLGNRSMFKKYFRYPACYVLIISCNSKALRSKRFEPKLSKLKMFRIFEEPSKIHVLRITNCLKTIIWRRHRVTRNDQNVTFLVSKMLFE